jgi:hypothetical protein
VIERRAKTKKLPYKISFLYILLENWFESCNKGGWCPISDPKSSSSLEDSR